MDLAEKYFIIAESSLREALDQARWGHDIDSVISTLEARKELEEVELA